MSELLYALREFLLTHFHQDWQLDFPIPAAVVEHFLRTARPGEAQAVAKDLHELLDRSLTEEQLHAVVLDEYSPYFDPWRHEISTKEWLEGMLRELEAGVRDEGRLAD